MVKEGYEWLICVNDADYELFRDLHGEANPQKWPTVVVRRVSALEGRPAKYSDFPWYGSYALVFSKMAASKLGHILEKNGTLLPLRTPAGESLYALDTQVIDALDEGRSKLTRLPSTGQIIDVENPVFDETRVADVDLFRLPFPTSVVYVCERFVNTVRRSGLVGLDFIPVLKAC